MRFDTSCDKCSFSIRNKVEQIGCEMRFAENFAKNFGGVVVDPETQSFILPNKVCPYRNYENVDKTIAWINSLLPMTFVIKFTGDFDALKTTLLSLTKCKYFYLKGSVTIVYDTRNTKQMIDFVAKHGIRQQQTHLVSILEEDSIWLNEAFRTCGNGYVVLVNAGFEVPNNIFSVLTHFVYNGMNRVAYVKPVDEFHNLRTIMAVFGKYLKLDNLYNIEDKIAAMTEEQNAPNMIFDWKEINDSYNV